MTFASFVTTMETEVEAFIQKATTEVELVISEVEAAMA